MKGAYVTQDMASSSGRYEARLHRVSFLQLNA